MKYEYEKKLNGKSLDGKFTSICKSLHDSLTRFFLELFVGSPVVGATKRGAFLLLSEGISVENFHTSRINSLDIVAHLLFYQYFNCSNTHHEILEDFFTYETSAVSSYSTHLVHFNLFPYHCAKEENCREKEKSISDIGINNLFLSVSSSIERFEAWLTAAERWNESVSCCEKMVIWANTRGNYPRKKLNERNFKRILT